MRNIKYHGDLNVEPCLLHVSDELSSRITTLNMMNLKR